MTERAVRPWEANPDAWEAYQTPKGRTRYRPKRPAGPQPPATTLWGCYQWLEARLVERGWPPTSPWWLERVQGFLEGGKRQAVYRVGRRGGKTTTMCRLAIVVTLWGGHEIPPADIGWLVIVSLKREFAEDVMRVLTKTLEVLGLASSPLSGGARGMLITGTPFGIRVLTASVGGVVSMTCVCAICDELARWRDEKTGTNPASEVLASLGPTMATQRKARIVLISSPIGQMDAHAAAFARGNTAYQVVDHAPTWEANPTLPETADWRQTDAATEDVWRREYAAIPLEGDEQSLFTPAMLDRCTRPEPTIPREEGVTYVAAQDPGFVRNAWTFVVACQRVCADGSIRRSIVHAQEWRGTRERPLNADVVLGEHIKPVLSRYGLAELYSDQAEKNTLRVIAERHGISLWVPTRSGPERIAKHEGMVAQMLDAQIELPPDKTLRADMLAVRLHLTPNGFTVRLPETPDGRHADYAPAVMLALDMAETAPVLTEPIKTQAQRDAEWEQEREKDLADEIDREGRADPWEREFARRGMG